MTVVGYAILSPMSLCLKCIEEDRTTCWSLEKDEETTRRGDEFLSRFPEDSQQYQAMLEVNRSTREGNLFLARQRGCTMIPPEKEI